MWNYFASKTTSIKSLEKKVDIPATKFNWCLLETNDSDLGSGVFFSSFEPGIKDCRAGTLYVVPAEYMKLKEKRRFTAYNARVAILEYYGITVNYNPKKYHEDDLF